LSLAVRTYLAYTLDQTALLPKSLADFIAAGDPVHMVRWAVERLDLGAFYASYAAERGRPPYHPKAMIGLLLYGACRGIYSSRKLEAACGQDVTFMYLMGMARPDFHTRQSPLNRLEIAADVRGSAEGAYQARLSPTSRKSAFRKAAGNLARRRG
jgi:transposase